ncbi:CgeB family protein [Lichenicoccus sp.]|uniref:CgeB family protein n=1 Tax=Lichenicoccus sp. TaxID=2781899 RepID=UPI003D12F1BA
MKIAFYGSSLLSSYWNGAATYYRGILRALAAHGHEICFYEPDAFDRQSHRDIEPPSWCRVVVYEASPEGVRRALDGMRGADVVVKASGVGYADDALLAGVLAARQAQSLCLFWDVDAPATLADIRNDPEHPLRRALGSLDLVLTYGGGAPVTDAYRGFGARDCIPIYNALDPATHHPVPPDARYVSDLSFLGNRLPDREARVEAFLLRPAAQLADRRFLLGGSGWADKPCSGNVVKLGHVATGTHNALNASAGVVLNISRDSMARMGFSPATRVFEVAGSGACLMTDHWDGLAVFLEPGREVLVVRDGADVVEALRSLDPRDAARIGQAGLARILREHTYDRRAVQLDRLLVDTLAAKRAGLPA